MKFAETELIETERLFLRGWRESDLEPFRAINSDPEVMEHFPSLLSADESDAFVERIQKHFVRHEFGLWAVEVKGGAPFIGYVGLLVPRFVAHFTPCVEIGWRLAADHWNKGYATEAAFAVTDHAFNQLGLSELVSMTVVQNTASRRVMEKIGMTHNEEDDFDHPMLPDGHELKRHVLYRITKSD